jgi:tetratricopeptide (TPR) repeat protein
LVKCNSCDYELSEDSMFCNKCGAKVGETNTDAKTRSNKLIIPMGIGGLLIVIILVSVFMLNSNPIDSFIGSVLENKSSEAIEVYENKIKGDSEKEKEVETLLKREIQSIKSDYLLKKIDYNAATVELETIQKTNLLKSEIDSMKKEINKINDSRTAFKTGQEFLDKENYREAIIEFKKVIEEDENYLKAQEFINDTKNEFKADVLSKAEQHASDENYIDAISVLANALTIIPKDPDVIAKKEVYEQENEEKIAV